MCGRWNGRLLKSSKTLLTTSEIRLLLGAWVVGAVAWAGGAWFCARSFLRSSSCCQTISAMVCSSSSSALSVFVKEGVGVVMVTTGGGIGIGLVWIGDGDRAATTGLVAGGEAGAGEGEAGG